METLSVSELSALSRQVRRDVLRMVHSAGSGHPGGALGAADILVALYRGGILEHDPLTFDRFGTAEDLFFLSNGHLSALWYSVLARSGYFPVSELGSFRACGSRLQGHPTPADGLPGVRIASGSLGQGLSVAAGAAIGKRLKGENPAHTVYVLLGDGELQEGQIWEAAHRAAHEGLNNLIAMVDLNGLQIDGPVAQFTRSTGVKEKWEAFGWNTIVAQGNDMDRVVEVLRETKQSQRKADRPLVILWETTMGSGVPFMENDNGWHGRAPGDEEFSRAMEALPETHFGDY